MLERRRIIELVRGGSAEVLVTLVRVRGSSYRRPGARLLTAAANTYAGTISGGCLETEVTRKAAWMVRQGACVQRYSTLFDDTTEIPYGLGCGGTVDLLFEPIRTPEAAALMTALEVSLVGIESRVMTWLPTPTTPLRRAVFSLGGEEIFLSASVDGSFESGSAVFADQANLYEERLEAPQRLILIGAGDDAKPVASIAALLGWSVVVADGRAHLATTGRFQDAQAVVVLRSARDCAEELAVTPSDAIVLMTHSYEQDRDCLASILAKPSQRYIGVLGARHRTSLLLSEASTLNQSSLGEYCVRVHAPVGLDLGGDGPEAIALAIVAEVQAVIQGKPVVARHITLEEVESESSRAGINRSYPAGCATNASKEALP